MAGSSGVGHIIAIDFDRVDITNLPRIVGATRWDACSLCTRDKASYCEELGKGSKLQGQRWRSAWPRVNPRIARYDAVVGDILDLETAALLKDADFISLASNSLQSHLESHAFWYHGTPLFLEYRLEQKCPR